MNVGVTATRDGLTRAQLATATAVLEELYEPGSALHHGGCKGGDVQLSIVADAIGYEPIVCHPADDVSEVWVAGGVWTVRREPLPALVRDREIVNETDVLVACPKGPERKRGSGTWATIRYARDVFRSRHIIIWPDGRREET